MISEIRMNTVRVVPTTDGRLKLMQGAGTFEGKEVEAVMDFTAAQWNDLTALVLMIKAHNEFWHEQAPLLRRYDS